MANRFFVTDPVTGVLDITASFETEAEAKAFIKGLEVKDEDAGRFTEGSYVIIDADESDAEE